MRVGIDARCLNTEHVRGMGKYVNEVLAHALREPPVEWVLFGDRPDTPMQVPPDIGARAQVFHQTGHRFQVWEQFGLPAASRRLGVDVLHCTATTLPAWQPVPTVVTVHDAIPWQTPPRGGFDRWYLNRLIPSALRRCAAVITISEASRRDLLAMWPWLDAKLHVIPHGVSDHYLLANQAPLNTTLRATIGGDRYLLYVGGAIARKRFAFAVDLLRRLGEPAVRLYALGFRRDEAESAAAALEPAIRARVVFASFVDETDMPALYREAIAVLYPTLYEGFGLPALEAQALGTPVLFSPLGSLAELRGPVARVLPPDDVEAWLAALRALVPQGSLRDPADTERARAWATRFSWEASARRHLEVYRAAARPA